MSRRVITVDMDGTPAVTESAIGEVMAVRIKAKGIDSIAVTGREETAIAIQAIVAVSGISELAGR